MHIPTILAWETWLADPATGINARIADVALWPGHTAPAPVSFIASPYTDGRVARWESPPTFPAVYITPDGPLSVQPEVATHSRDGQPVPVALRYIVQKSTSENAARDAAYVMDAVLLSTRAFLADDAAGRAARHVMHNAGVGGFHIRTADAASYGPWSEHVGEAVAIAAFAVTFHVRNYAP